MVRESCSRPRPGSGDFSDIAARLAGLVPATIGWTPGQFWRATPAELVTIFTAFAAHDLGMQAPMSLDSEQFEQLKETYPDG